MKPTGRAWAYIASAWRLYSSYDECSEDLIDKLKAKGYLAAKYNRGNKPTACPSRKQILEARGLSTEEETPHND